MLDGCLKKAAFSLEFSPFLSFLLSFSAGAVLVFVLILSQIADLAGGSLPHSRFSPFFPFYVFLVAHDPLT